MTSFRFRLESVLEWRRKELELAEARFRQQAAALAELGRQNAELETAGNRMEIQVREWSPVSGGDLAALGAFRLQTRKRVQALAARRAECHQELAKRQGAMLEARRRLRLLERLRERRFAEWQTAFERELEQQAAASYLARWSGR